MAGNYVPSAILIGSAELIRELGGDPFAIARDVGMPTGAIIDPDLLITGRTTYAFFERAAGVCSYPSLGVRLGSQASFAAVIGPLWLLVRGTRTVRQMLEELASNWDLYSSNSTISVEHLDDGLVLSWSSTSGYTGCEVQVAGYALALMCQEIRLHCVHGWRPEAVEFRHAAPLDLSEYRRVFGNRLSFNSDRNALILDRTTAETATGTVDSRRRLLTSSLLREQFGYPSVSERVERAVRAILPFGPCYVADIAKALGVSVRSLQRRLGAGSRSFGDIKDAVRADLALKYVQHSDLSLAEIGEILGYAELGAFSHAFRRWHGVAARDIRKTTIRHTT